MAAKSRTKTSTPRLSELARHVVVPKGGGRVAHIAADTRMMRVRIGDRPQPERRSAAVVAALVVALGLPVGAGAVVPLVLGEMDAADVTEQCRLLLELLAEDGNIRQEEPAP